MKFRTFRYAGWLAMALALAGRGNAQTPPHLTTLYSFPGAPNGYDPAGGLALGADGVLYGTTRAGGEHYYGTVFSLAPPSAPGGAWTETVLYSFTGGLDGGDPSNIAIGAGGVIYGTTLIGGTGNPVTCGNSPYSACGTVFSLTPPAAPSGQWTEAVLHNFQGGSDGAGPLSGVIVGRGGVLYGTTAYGGNGTVGAGTVFMLTPPATPGGAWSESLLHVFFGGTSDGSGPNGGLALGPDGVLYGTTIQGGASQAGTVYSLTPPSWTLTLLFSFYIDGYYPESGLVIDQNGVLYGSTAAGPYPDIGTVFSLAPPASPGGAWTQTVLLDFASPTLAISDTGVLYGSYPGYKSDPGGWVFSMAPVAGGGFNYTMLHNFKGYKHGRNPAGPLAVGKRGAVYGVTTGGGASYVGSVFAITP